MEVRNINFGSKRADRAASLILSPQEEIRLFDPDRVDRADRAAGLILEFDPERANKTVELIEEEDGK